MGEDTSNLMEAAGMELVEGDDYGMDDEKREAMSQEMGRGRGQAQARGGAGDELVGVVAEDNVDAVEEAGNDRIRRVDSSQMEGDHNFHIDSGEVDDHTQQADQAVGCDNDVKDVEVAVAQRVHTNSCHDDRTERGRGAVGWG